MSPFHGLGNRGQVQGGAVPPESHSWGVAGRRGEVNATRTVGLCAGERREPGGLSGGIRRLTPR